MCSANSQSNRSTQYLNFVFDADRDFLTAFSLLQLPLYSYKATSAAYHIAQALEKYIKAFLCDINFPSGNVTNKDIENQGMRKHNLPDLFDQLLKSQNSQIPPFFSNSKNEIIACLRKYDRYTVEFRYSINKNNNQSTGREGFVCRQNQCDKIVRQMVINIRNSIKMDDDKRCRRLMEQTVYNDFTNEEREKFIEFFPEFAEPRH